MTWNPPFKDIIWRLICFCKMLKSVSAAVAGKEEKANYAMRRMPISWWKTSKTSLLVLPLRS